MEAISNSTDDMLINDLSFKLPPSANYIVDRSSSTWHPAGSNIYKSTATKLIKIQLTGSGFLDLSTVKVIYDLYNDASGAAGSNQIRALGSPATFISRVRILAGGTILEDVSEYGRVHTLMKMLKPAEQIDMDNCEGFGVPDMRTVELNDENFHGINPGEHQTAMFKPCSGLLQSGKMIPLSLCPLTFECEVISTATDPIQSAYTTGSNALEVANTSSNWHIENVMIKADVLKLDNQLENSYMQHALEGKALTINFPTYISQMQSILSGVNGQQKVQLSVTRALSRLAKLFVTFDNSDVRLPSTAVGATGKIQTLVKNKPWNSFYSVMEHYTEGSNNKYSQNGEFEFQVSVGSKNMPDYPIRSHAEAFSQLRKCMRAESFDITPNEYRRRKFVLGLDFEKAGAGVGFSGMNTKSGDLMNLRWQTLNSQTDAENYPKQMHIVLVADCVCEIRDSGIQVYD